MQFPTFSMQHRWKLTVRPRSIFPRPFHPVAATSGPGPARRLRVAADAQDGSGREATFVRPSVDRQVVWSAVFVVRTGGRRAECRPQSGDAPTRATTYAVAAASVALTFPFVRFIAPQAGAAVVSSFITDG